MDRKMIIALLLAVIVISAGAYVLLNNGQDGADGPVTVTDARGRNVTTASIPLRIVSCSPSSTEIVYSLGIGERLVAVTDHCDWPEDVVTRKGNGSLASIGEYYIPNVEKIVEAEPDIVLLDNGVQAQLDMMPQLNTLGINYIVLYKGLTFDEVYDNIALIGGICWEDHAADELTDSMKDRISGIQDAIGDATEKPTVVFAVWLEPIYLSGNGTFSHDMMTLALGTNAFSDMTSWPEVSVESLLDRQPDYLLVSMMYLPETGEQILQDLANDTLWSTLEAVQNDRVYIFTGQADNVFSRPGPRMVDGVELMAMIMHPEAFNITLPHVISDNYIDWVSSSSIDGETIGAPIGLMTTSSSQGVNLIAVPAYLEAFEIES